MPHAIAVRARRQRKTGAPPLSSPDPFVAPTVRNQCSWVPGAIQGSSRLTPNRSRHRGPADPDMPTRARTTDMPIRTRTKRARADPDTHQGHLLDG